MAALLSAALINELDPLGATTAGFCWPYAGSFKHTAAWQLTNHPLVLQVSDLSGDVSRGKGRRTEGIGSFTSLDIGVDRVRPLFLLGFRS